jgi:peptide/nickel transport system permease protein
MQYLVYMKNALTGELGMSFTYREPVSSIILDRLQNTLMLVAPAAMLAFLLGISTGIVAAWRRNTPTDYGLLGASLFTYSVPTFWLGMMLIFVLAGRVPSAGMYTAGAMYGSVIDQFLDFIRHLVTPLIVLTAVLYGQYVMLMRSSLIDVLQEDYMTTGKAKGLTNRSLLRHHAVPNALLPIVTVTAINMSFVVGGAIQTETIFSWPGVGRLMFDSLFALDYPILQGCFIMITFVALTANVIADIAYAFLDPRVKIG